MHPYILLQCSTLWRALQFQATEFLLAYSIYSIAIYTCLCYFFSRAELQQKYQAIQGRSQDLCKGGAQLEGGVGIVWP